MKQIEKFTLILWLVIAALSVSLLSGCENNGDDQNKPTENGAVAQQDNDDSFGNSDEAGW